MIVLDTNSIIYYLNGEPETVAKFRRLLVAKKQFLISTISELELFSYPDLTLEERLKINLWLNIIYVVPVDSIIAQKAAELRRMYKIKTPDAIIAATAILNGGKLISKDAVFKRIREIDLV